MHEYTGQVPTVLAVTPHPDLATVRDQHLLALEILCDQRAILGRELLTILGIVRILLQELAFDLGVWRLQLALGRDSSVNNLPPGLCAKSCCLTISCSASLDSLS